MADEKNPEVRITRGRVDSLVFYEVTEDELDVLEHGPASALYLNFAIGIIPVGLSFATTLFTVPIPSLIVFVVFLVITLVALIAGVVLLVVWYKTRGSYRVVISRIKARVEKPVVKLDVPDAVIVENSEQN